MVQFLVKSVNRFKIYWNRKFLILTSDSIVKITNFGFLATFLWLLYGAIVGKISQAIQDLSQILNSWPLILIIDPGVKVTKFYIFNLLFTVILWCNF